MAAAVSGGRVDDQLKKLVKELGEAINQAVADSDRIAEVMGRIRARGHDVFLALEASIGFTQRDDAGDELPRKKTSSTGELEITSQDQQFLRSLRIAVTDER
jgi:hypothetical protein